MIKSYQQYLFEATQDRSGDIKLSTTGGGLKEPAISFETARNPEATGSVVIELYTKGPKTYKYTPTPEILAQMDIINSETEKDEKVKKTAEENIRELINNKQTELSADLLQLFTQLDQDIQEVLKKHNIE